jgi:1-deoxy-D-xylulose-5-phosphate reductoisomerase
MPCIMNAANEVAVQQFIDGRISFLEIADTIEAAMQTTPFIPNPSLDDLLQTDKSIRTQ